MQIVNQQIEMAEDLDVDALLEAPYQKSDKQEEVEGFKSRQNGTSEKISRKDKDRKRSRSRDRKDKKSSRSDKRSRSRDRKRSRSQDRRDKKRSRSRDRKQSRSKDRKRSRSKDKKRSRSRDTKPNRSRDKKRSRSRDIKDNRSKDRKSSRSRDRRRSRSKDKKKAIETKSSRDRKKDYKRKSKSPKIIKKSPSPSPLRLASDDLTPEERDARTVFCMQLSARIRARDLEDFFSSVGKVKDVRLIMCNKTRRFKGISYIEFRDVDSVPLAMGLSGQKVLGIPIIVQHTQAEKNRAANPIIIPPQKSYVGPMRLYIGSLHFNITEDMLRAIFEPFGKIDSIQLMMDPETGRSKGYGFITFHSSEDAKKALEQLNGFELAGRPMKVGNVTERTDLTAAGGPSLLDSDELDRSGIDLGATGRLQLMAKLAKGTGFEIPAAAANALNMNSMGTIAPQSQTPSIATQCVMLCNMFDPTSETNPRWVEDIRDDVIEECNKHGGVLHVYVDKASPSGNVYLKCPTISSAAASVNALHGRWFAGKVITAAYVPLLNYHSLFQDAMSANQLLLPSANRMAMM